MACPHLSLLLKWVVNGILKPTHFHLTVAFYFKAKSAKLNFCDCGFHHRVELFNLFFFVVILNENRKETLAKLIERLHISHVMAFRFR